MKITIRHLVLAHRILDSVVVADDGSKHRVGYLAADGWFCTCTAGKRCTHIDAVRDVATPLEEA